MDISNGLTFQVQSVSGHSLSWLRSKREAGTVDDLGVGAVRDAIADHLFPGISTIQTRAKYFLFLAWIFKSLEQSQVADERIEASLKEKEVEADLCATRRS